MTYQPKCYRTDGGDKTVIASGGTLSIEEGGVLEFDGALLTTTAAQELTASGAVTAGVQSVELNDTAAIVAATIADAANHQGLFVVKNTSASGTRAHALTLTAGTFDGTNNVATLDAPNECLVVYFDSAGNGTIVVNVGTVGVA